MARQVVVDALKSPTGLSQTKRVIKEEFSRQHCINIHNEWFILEDPREFFTL